MDHGEIVSGRNSSGPRNAYGNALSHGNESVGN